jgi:hypothetical protein
MPSTLVNYIQLNRFFIDKRCVLLRHILELSYNYKLIFCLYIKSQINLTILDFTSILARTPLRVNINFFKKKNIKSMENF